LKSIDEDSGMRNFEIFKLALISEDPVFIYSRRGDLEGIKKYVNILNIDSRDKKGYSPLMLAAYHGHSEAVKLLLSLSADIHSRDHHGNSILMAATFNGHIDIVEILLQHGADPDACNYKKQTALVFARTFGLKAIEKVLDRAS
jgi:ankyrin repeat protein